jgi:hypothetical protein
MSDETTYKEDRRGVAEMMVSPEMHGAVELVALEAIPFAKSISPDATPYGVGYIDSWEVHGGTERIARARRATADLVNTKDYATAVELGDFGDQSAKDTGHHVLARTADHIERG